MSARWASLSGLMQITSITPHPRKADRVTVHLDGAAAQVVHIGDLVRLSLRVGQTLDAAAQEALDAAAQVQKTYDRALRMLAARPRARAELGRLLLRKGEDRAHVEPVLERLARVGLLDDEAFARHYARARMGAGTRSAGQVRRELVVRGIAPDRAEAALREVVEADGIDVMAGLRALAERRLRALRGLEAQVRRRRLFGYLQRRGFGAREVMQVLQQLGV